MLSSWQEECDWKHETEGEVQQSPLNSQISREVVGGGAEVKVARWELSPWSYQGTRCQRREKRWSFPTNLHSLLLEFSVFCPALSYSFSKISDSLCSAESLRARYTERSGFLLI